MARYEIGTPVLADALRIGDRFGDEYITAIRPHYDPDITDHLEGYTVAFTDGTRLYADTGEVVVAPHHHAVEVTVGEGGLAVVFTCLAHGVSDCRRVCGRCGSTYACYCPATPTDGGYCRAAERFHAMPADAVLRAYDGLTVPLRSGPVAVLDTRGGYRWRYPPNRPTPLPPPNRPRPRRRTSATPTHRFGRGAGGVRPRLGPRTTPIQESP